MIIAATRAFYIEVVVSREGFIDARCDECNEPAAFEITSSLDSRLAYCVRCVPDVKLAQLAPLLEPSEAGEDRLGVSLVRLAGEPVASGWRA